jgi:hypothetical protein
LNAGIAELALGHARNCHLLYPGTESNRLMALCYLIQENWNDAVNTAPAAFAQAATPSSSGHSRIKATEPPVRPTG